MEVLVLRNASAGRAVVVQLFEREDHYRRGEEVFSAMPATDTPGWRAAMGRYDVAARMKS